MCYLVSYNYRIHVLNIYPHFHILSFKNVYTIKKVVVSSTSSRLTKYFNHASSKYTSNFASICSTIADHSLSTFKCFITAS